ncbi:MAG TPA: triose-phosphate isomerase [Candidatus Paceibacterota bacterium]
MNSIIVANWKMNPASASEAKKLFEATRRAGESVKNVSIVVAPPTIFLRELTKFYKGRTIAFAAQNGHSESAGAFTGDISMPQIKDAHAVYVIIGHSERRAAGETNETMGKKVVAALTAKIAPILCVGELKRTASGEYFRFIRDQLRAGLAEVPAGKITQCIVAYEPVWAIGGEEMLDPHDMHEMSIFIRKTIVEMHGERGMAVKVLYGGSVNETNAHRMLLDGNADGFLIGHVSVNPYRFAALLESL